MPCINEKQALITYNIISVSNMFVIFSKLIPPVPSTFKSSQLNISVVACPNIVGPIILNIVPAMANKNIKNNGV